MRTFFSIIASIYVLSGLGGIVAAFSFPTPGAYVLGGISGITLFFGFWVGILLFANWEHI